MRDELVLGHALWQHPCAEQLDPGDQLTALDASRGQILLDDEHRDLVLFDQIHDVVIHARRLGLLPPTDGEPRRALTRDRAGDTAAALMPSIFPTFAEFMASSFADCL